MGDELIALVAGVVIGFVLFFLGISNFRLMKLIRDTPTSKIRSIAMGFVELYGEVVPLTQKKVLKSPLSNATCIYYRYLIQEYRSSGKSGRWVTINKGSEKEYFNLKDNTGSVMVDTDDAKIDMPVRWSLNTKFGGSPPAQIKAFMKKQSLKHKGLLFNKSLRFQEYYIAPKDKIYIIGSAGDNPLVEDATGRHNVDDIMIQKGNHKIYYISNESEDKVVSKLKTRVLLYMLGGGALGVGCLAILFAIFNFL